MRSLCRAAVLAVLATVVAVLPAAHAAASDEPRVATFVAATDCDVKGGPGTLTTSYCGASTLNVGYAAATSTPVPYARRALLRFDLSTLPAGAVVVDATLSMSLLGAKPAAYGDVTVHEPGAAWTTSATWLSPDSRGVWPVPGGAPSAEVARAQAGPFAGRVSWQGLGGLVRTWRSAPASNHGLLLKKSTEGPDELNYAFAASEASDPALRPTLTVRYATPPDAPVVVATAGYGALSATWSRPGSNGSPVTGYTARTYTAAGTLVDSATVTTPAYHVSGLTIGAAYRVVVTATNAAGTGASGTSPDVVPYGLPSAPTGLTATARAGSVDVAWDGADGNGAPVTGWLVTVTDGVTSETTSLPGRYLATPVYGLQPGRAYTVTVAAVNAAGTGPDATAGPVTPFDVPDAPRDVTVVAGRASVTVGWTAPAADGGSPITGYRIAASDLGGDVVALVDTGPDATSAVVEGLPAGFAYTVAVVATNAGGHSVEATAGPVMPVDVPTTPWGVEVERGNASVAVTWEPAYDNGSPVTAYTVRALDPSGAVVATVATAGDARRAVVDGLQNGTAYTVEVSATNAAGTGPAASGGPATPQDVPGEMRNVRLTADETSVTATWDAPADGAPWTHYVLFLAGPDEQGISVEVPAGTTSWTFDGLPTGTYYFLRAVAVNDAGPGLRSTTYLVQTGERPATPVVTATASSYGRVDVSWGPGDGPVASEYTVRLVRASDGAIMGEHQAYGPGTWTFWGEPGTAYYATAVVTAEGRWSDVGVSDVVTP